MTDDDRDVLRPVMEHVAREKSRREGWPIAVERCPTHWTVRPAAEPTPAGYERLIVKDAGGLERMTIDPDWLLRMAESQDDGCISAGLGLGLRAAAEAERKAGVPPGLLF